MVQQVDNLEDLFSPYTQYLYGYVSTDALEMDAFLKEMGFHHQKDDSLKVQREDLNGVSDGLTFYSAKCSSGVLIECRDLSSVEISIADKLAGFPVMSRFRFNLGSKSTHNYLNGILAKICKENQNIALINDTQTSIFRSISRSY
jgi:hypothetical protein